MQYDVVVVGAGPAGLATALNAAAEGLSTRLLDAGTSAGGQASASALIENYPGFQFGVDGSALVAQMIGQAERLGAVLTEGVRVHALKRVSTGFMLDTESERVEARSVVVASGLEYNRLAIDGAGKQNVLVGATASDAKRFRDKEVVVVGGGNSAGQAACQFARYARRVRLFVRDASLSKYMSKYLLDRVTQAPNIEVRYSTSLTEVCGDVECKTIRYLTRGMHEEAQCDGVVVHIGGKPRTDFVDGVARRDPLGYVVAASLATSTPGLFAVGDVRAGSMKRVAAAVGEGASVVPLVWRFLNP